MQLLSKDLECRIDDIVRNRFYNQVTPYDVIRWLFNFEEPDVDLAIQLLEHVLFLRDDDVKKRLYDQFRKIPSQCKIHIVPLGKPGKSGMAVSYWVHGLAKRNVEGKMRFYSGIESFIEYRNSKKWTDLNDIVVYVDDFIGSGGSVKNALSLAKHLRKEVLSDARDGRLYIVAAIVMANGFDYVKRIFPGIKILGDLQSKGFDPHVNLFGSYFKTKTMREMCYKYGLQLYHDNPLGFENTQSLVIMQHSSPNNSVPVLWSDNEYNGKKWIPLVPRNNLLRIERAYIDRMSVNRWLFCLKKFFVGDCDKVDFCKLFTKRNANLAFILICLLRKKSEPVIMNVIGISYDEMESLWKDGVDKGLWNKQHEPTSFALSAYGDVIKRYKILKNEENQEHENKFDDREHIYIPETFRGVK